MRIALITLAVAALAFIGSIIWIFATKNGINLIPMEGTNTSVKISTETANLEILRSQWKTEERIKNLEAKIESLSGKNPTTEITISSSGSTGSIAPQSISNTGNTVVPISAKFLTKIITKVNLVLTKNNGIYGLYLFDNSNEYSTYSDEKYGITIVASRTPYDTWLKNFKAIDKSLFTINETKTFSFPGFYVNSTKADSTIRLVLQVEAQTLMLSIPKNKFNEFKAMLLKK
jgi:hypothetical protein